MDTKTSSEIRTVEISVPAQMEPLLKASGLTLEQLIESYLCDLGQCANGSNGSDERDMASGYFLRCRDHDRPNSQVRYVFDYLCGINFSWYRYGRERADEFVEFERREIAELMVELEEADEAIDALD